MENEPCKDDWHLSYKELVEKYGANNSDNHYKPYRTCPSCGAKIIPGD